MKENGVEQVHSLSTNLFIQFQWLISNHLFMRLQVVLETEFDNSAALALYESLGFIREKRLYRFYMNGKDAFRLVLSIPPSRATSTVASFPGSSSIGKAPLLVPRSRNRQAMYNTRVVPEFVAGFDDSDDSEDGASRR